MRSDCIGIDSGIDLIVKTHKKIFLSYNCFQAQLIYYITVSSYEHGAEKILTLSNIQQCQSFSNESCLAKRTYT